MTGMSNLGQHVEHLGTVGPAVDAELVLDNGNVVGRQGLGRAGGRAAPFPHEVVDDLDGGKGFRLSTMRTMPERFPALTRCVESDCVNVAKPHCVGGYVLRKPKDKDTLNDLLARREPLSEAAYAAPAHSGTRDHDRSSKPVE